MDILHLINRLEELFNESRSIPFTHSVVIDEDRMLDIIDQMRVSIPDEIEKSQQILKQKERHIAQAQEEASRIIQIAREKADQLVQESEITQKAKALADQMIAQAHAETEKIRHESDKYIMDSLVRLEIELERSLKQVRNGIRLLQSQQSYSEKTQQE